MYTYIYRERDTCMYTDICIVNDNCLFSIPASKLNIKLPKSQLDFMFNKFPKNKLLKEVILTGRKFSAYEALNFHLIQPSDHFSHPS